MTRARIYSLSGFASLALAAATPADAAPACAPPASVANPAGAGPFASGTTTYALPAVRIGVDTVRLAATVRYPASASGNGATIAGSGAFPIVFFLHGNHGIWRLPNGVDVCADIHREPGVVETPNDEGYDYILDNLASAGFIAVSINGNDLNCKTDRVLERGQLIWQHVALWKAIAAGAETRVGGAMFGGRVDLSKVGLFGHSRGGEAVVTAAESPQDPDVGIAGVLSVAPVDFHDPVLKDTPYLVVLPAADGDVVGNDGAKIYDRAQVGAAFKAQEYVYGANHNFFNTEWKQDEGVGENRISADDQRNWLLSTTRAFFDKTIGGDDAMTDVLSGAAVVDGLVPDVFPSFESGGATTIDDYLAHDATTNTMGGAVTHDAYATFALFDFAQSGAKYNDSFFGASRGLVAAWSGGTPAFTSALPAPLDLGNFSFVSLRVAVVADPLAQSDAVLGVTLVDAAGHSAAVGTDRIGARIPAPYRRDGSGPKSMLRTVRVPLACFDGSGIATDRISAFQISAGAATQGALAFDRIALAK